MPTISADANPRLLYGEADALILRASDMKKMLTPVDLLFRRNERKLFSTEGSSGGPKWQALKQSTIDRKKRARAGISKIKKRGFSIPLNSTSMKIMQRTGNLRKGATQPGHPDHFASFTLQPGNSSIRVGVRNIVAAYHGADYALKGRNRKLPIRNVLQMTMPQRRAYLKIVATYQIKKIEANRARFNRARLGARNAILGKSMFSNLIKGRSVGSGR